MSSKGKKSRPASTAVISQPQVEDASTPASLSQFSPHADLFAFLSLAVDKHRLRVFNAIAGGILAEHIVDDARVTSLEWALLSLSSDATRVQQSRKKRKKTTDPPPEVSEGATPIVVLGLSGGSLLLFSPTHARVLRTLSHASSLAATLATSSGPQPYHVWSSHADGTLRLWDASRNELLGTWKKDDDVPYSALVPRSVQSSDAEVELLVANHTIRVLSLPTSKASVSDTIKPTELVSFTGHDSPVSRLRWDASQPSRFISTAEADRFVQVWHIPDPPTKEGVMVASVPLDASIRHAALSPLNTAHLLAVSASGKLVIFELPAKTKKVVTLSPHSTVITPSKKGEDDVPVVAASFVPEDLGSIRVARLHGGIRPIFEVVRYLNDSSEFISQVSLSKDVSAALAAGADGGLHILPKRYTEAPSLAARSGLELGQDATMDDIPARDADGDLDVDLAELSLGQRLTALNGGRNVTTGDGSSEDEAKTRRRRRKKTRGGNEAEGDHLTVPASSLSRMLVQALHSGDTRLLETCLTHSDEKLVLNTVRRLPPQLVIPLLDACVERLGRGGRVGIGKGGGGGASSQRGTGLIRWVRAVLVVHTAHIMTIPDVVARLSSLHATMTARLALRDPLLSLSGRLDLVLSQIQIRSSAGPAPIAPEGKYSKGEKRAPVKYVEGESGSEGEGEGEGNADVMEVEKDHDAGSVEEVELDGESGSGEEAESERGSIGDDDDEEESEEDASDEGSRLNGFIDDEAEEWSGEDEDEEYSEE